MLLETINMRRENGKLNLSEYPLFAVDLFDLLTVGLSYEMPFSKTPFSQTQSVRHPGRPAAGSLPSFPLVLTFTCICPQVFPLMGTVPREHR